MTGQGSSNSGRRATASLCLLVLLIAPMLCAAQFGQKKDPPPKAPVSKGDLKFIRCQVCEAFVKQSLTAVKGLKEKLKPKQKLTEAEIIDSLEKMCDPDEDAGDWITQIDIVEEGDKLRLEDTGSLSDCNGECRTIAKACEELSDKLDLTEVSEELWLGKKKRAALQQLLCYDVSGVCGKKTPPVPKGRVPGPKHVGLDEGAVSRKKMMRGLKGSGMSGTMYDRDSIQDEMAQMREMGMTDEDFDAVADMPTEPAGGGGFDENGVFTPTPEVLGPSGLGSDLGRAASGLKEGAAKVVDAVGNAASSVYDTVAGALGGKKKAEL